MGDLAILAVLVMVGVVATYLAGRARNRHAQQELRWRPDEMQITLPTTGESQGAIQLVCRRGGDIVRVGHPLLVDDPDFEYLIEELRASQLQKLTALNHRSLGER